MFPLTHDEEVVLLLHGLVDDLGGDLAGVVARHVRVHLPQHHALRVATTALQQHQDIRAMARSPIIMMIFSLLTLRYNFGSGKNCFWSG